MDSDQKTPWSTYTANLETILVSLLGLSTSLVKNFGDLAIISSLTGMTTDRFSAMHLCVTAVADRFSAMYLCVPAAEDSFVSYLTEVWPIVGFTVKSPNLDFHLFFLYSKNCIFFKIKMGVGKH